MLYKLLDETWGHDGFINWLRSLSSQYSQRRDILVDACKRQLLTAMGVGLDKTNPVGGAFFSEEAKDGTILGSELDSICGQRPLGALGLEACSTC